MSNYCYSCELIASRAARETHVLRGKWQPVLFLHHLFPVFFPSLSLSLFLPQGFSCDVTIPSSATHFFPFAFLSHRVADGTRVISSPSKGSGRPPVSIRQLATPTTLFGIYVRHYYIKNMSEMSLCTSDSSYLTVYRPSMSANVCALK